MTKLLADAEAWSGTNWMRMPPFTAVALCIRSAVGHHAAFKRISLIARARGAVHVVRGIQCVQFKRVGNAFRLASSQTLSSLQQLRGTMSVSHDGTVEVITADGADKVMARGP